MSQISLTFQFENIHQLTEFCARCAPHLTHRAVTESGVPAVVVADANSLGGHPHDDGPFPGIPGRGSEFGRMPSPSSPPPAPTTNRRRGRKSNAEKAAEAAALKNAAPAEAMSPPLIVSEDSKPVAAPVITKDDVLDAFKKLHEAKGMGPCIDLLKRHGATRFGEVLPEAYPRFMKDIADILAGKDIAAAA